MKKKVVATVMMQVVSATAIEASGRNGEEEWWKGRV